VKLGKNASGTCAVLAEAYSGEAMKKPSAFEWHKRIKVCRENVENERSECPGSQRIDENERV
jgi:hypothetical protein